jgi:L-rhamnose mutarotase
MTYRKRRNTDEESTMNVLAADRDPDEHGGNTDEEDEILQRWWLHIAQINEEGNDEEEDGN